MKPQRDFSIYYPFIIDRTYMEKSFDYRSIKTFEDACEHLGLNAYQLGQKYQFLPDHLASLVKLEIITRALNDGWKNPLDNRAICHYNYAYTLTEKEAETWDWTGRVKVHYQRPDGSAGLGCADSSYGWSYSYSSLGSRLAYKSRELAVYSLRTFTMLWESFLYPQKWHREDKDGAMEW